MKTTLTGPCVVKVLWSFTHTIKQSSSFVAHSNSRRVVFKSAPDFLLLIQRTVSRQSLAIYLGWVGDILHSLSLYSPSRVTGNRSIEYFHLLRCSHGRNILHSLLPKADNCSTDNCSTDMPTSTFLDFKNS